MHKGLAGKSIVAVAHVSSRIGVRERKRESSLGWDGFYIILCHQTTQHLILSSAYQTNPLPPIALSHFFPVRWESTHSGLVPWIAHYIVDKDIYGLFLLYTNHIKFSSVYNIIKEIFWDHNKLNSVNGICAIITTNKSFSLDLGYS